MYLKVNLRAIILERQIDHIVMEFGGKLTRWLVNSPGEFERMKPDGSKNIGTSLSCGSCCRRTEFSTVCCDPHSQSFGIANKEETDVFLKLSCFFHDPVDVGNLISGSSAFSKTSLNIRKFMVHVLLKPGLENFEHYFTSK